MRTRISSFNSNIKVEELGEGELEVVRILSAEMDTEGLRASVRISTCI